MTFSSIVRDEYRRRLYIAGIKRRLFRPKKFAHSGITIGIDYNCFSDVIVDHMLAGYYETDELSVIDHLIRPDDKVLEIGAGVGFTSSYIAKQLSKKGSIECFEGNPHLIPIIKKNHQRNGVDIKVNNVILAKEPGTTTFYLADNFWSSSLGDKKGKEVVLPQVSFQDYLDNSGPTMLVVDIEGGEIELFKGIVLKSVEKICIELHPGVTGVEPMNQLIKSFQAQGFQLREEMSKTAVKAFVRQGTAV